MLKGLRIQLLLLSLVAALGLVVLLGGGSYYFLKLYMQRSTDLALRAKMALQFRQYGLALPPELAKAEQDWLGNQNLPTMTAQQVAPVQLIAAPLITLRPAPTKTPIIIFPLPTLAATQIPPAATEAALATSQGKGSGIAEALEVQPEKPATRPPINSGEDGEDGDDGEDNEGGEGNDDKAVENKVSLSKTLPTATVTSIPSKQKSATSAGSTSKLTATTPETVDGGAGEDGGDRDDLSLPAGAIQSTADFEMEKETLDERLNSVFIIPLDTSGQVIQNANQPVKAVVIDEQANANALSTGYDLRTTQLRDGSRARLLTYRTVIKEGPELLQVGRLLNEQDQILSSFLTGVIILAAISAVLLGLGSWWLSGRALSPAQRAWENQQTFIANASHELRAPLTLVKANAEVGLRLAPPPEQSEVLTEILHESDYMNRLVEDLLLLSRLDTHRLKLERTTITVKDLLEEVQRQMSLIADSKTITINLGQTAGKVWGDPVRLRQVILILIDNALRYTPAGGQIILASYPSDRWVQIVVSDNGAGIPATDLPHVFDRFYQAQRNGEQESQGNGLGLSIAKALIEAQGGEIQIASEPGQGTRVSLRLPSSI
jgi:signal transduction histidine kinase